MDTDVVEYYLPDEDALKRAMRPIATFNFASEKFYTTAAELVPAVN